MARAAPHRSRPGPISTRSGEAAGRGCAASAGSERRELALDFRGVALRALQARVGLGHAAQHLEGIPTAFAVILIDRHCTSILAPWRACVLGLHLFPYRH